MDEKCVSYVSDGVGNSNFCVGGFPLTVNSDCTGTGSYIYNTWDWWNQNYYSYSYPVYTESKVDVAFRILKKLFDEGYLERVKISKFIKLVHEIAKEL